MTALNFPDERELIILLRQGDSKAFGLIYHAYKKRIYTTLKKMLYSEVLAEELLQEVFYKLWKNRGNLDPDQSFSAYLYRIAASLVYDHFRKVSLDKKLQAHLIAHGSELYDHINALTDYKDADQQLQQAIALLSPQRQKVFKLCKIEGKTYEEAATILGISPSTVNDHIVKAMRLIKAEFSNEAFLFLLFVYLLNK